MNDNNPIVCLGKEFNSEEERREYFRNELRAKLPELKKIEGFPIGEDDDILNLSDPPYYTACPNPWLNDFIAEWEKEKEFIPGRKKDFHVDEPYASDVSEGKNNPIYNAHSYHTKVPHPAIMRYILHYTQPGDIVLDGFAGTGMTGVAAQLCGGPDRETKFRFERDFQYQAHEIFWGARKVICGDLSPIASFIAYNYNTPIDVFQFEKHAADVSKKVKEQWDWMFETKHNNREVGKINFTTWSDVFICPNCSSEIIFYDVAVNHEAEEIRDAFICTSCKSSLTKNDVTKAEITVYDRTLKKAVKQSKTVPVLINYSWRGKRYEKRPDNEDLLLLRKIEEMNVPDWFPSEPMMGIGGEWGDTWRSGIHTGITHVHHFHLPSNNIGLAAFWNNLPFNRIGNGLRLAASAANPNFSRLRRYRPDGKGGGPLAGTLYISSITTPQNCFTSIMRNVEFVQKAFNLLASNEIGNSIIFTNSCTQLVQKVA